MICKVLDSATNFALEVLEFGFKQPVLHQIRWYFSSITRPPPSLLLLLFCSWLLQIYLRPTLDLFRPLCQSKKIKNSIIDEVGAMCSQLLSIYDVDIAWYKIRKYLSALSSPSRRYFIHKHYNKKIDGQVCRYSEYPVFPPCKFSIVTSQKHIFEGS